LLIDFFLDHNLKKKYDKLELITSTSLRFVIITYASI